MKNFTNFFLFFSHSRNNFLRDFNFRIPNTGKNKFYSLYRENKEKKRSTKTS